MKRLLLLGILALIGCERSDPNNFSMSLTGRQTVPNAPALNEILFVDAGQSNMQANSQKVEFPSDPNVVMVNNTRRGPAYEFGVLYAQDHPGTKVIIVGCAVGGTTMFQWQKGGVLYQNCFDLLSQQRIRPSAMLWQQGESEGSYNDQTMYTTWGAEFTQFVNDFRRDLGQPNLPVLYGRLADNYFHTLQWDNIRDQQTMLSISNGRMVSMDGVELDSANYIHYTDAGYRESGRRYYQAYTNFK